MSLRLDGAIYRPWMILSQNRYWSNLNKDPLNDIPPMDVDTEYVHSKRPVIDNEN